jgi:hypothetical protein
MKTYSVKTCPETDGGEPMEWRVDGESPKDAVSWALGHDPDDLPEPDENGRMWIAEEYYTVKENVMGKTRTKTLERRQHKQPFPRGVVLYCENGFGSMFPLRR